MPADNDLYACYVAEIASKQNAFIYNPTNRKKTKTYGLEGLYTSLRQGRSLPLPTLPFQRTNRYAVVNSMQTANRQPKQGLWHGIHLLKDQPLRGS